MKKATPKKTTQKKSTCMSCCDITGDEVKEKIHDVADELGGLIKKAKGKYDKADPETKIKIKKGLIGAGALLAGIMKVKSIKNKKKK